MKLSQKFFAAALVSTLSTVAIADDIGRDLIYGSERVHVDFNQMPATAAGKTSASIAKGMSDQETGNATAIPDYLEGLNSNQ